MKILYDKSFWQKYHHHFLISLSVLILAVSIHANLVLAEDGSGDWQSGDERSYSSGDFCAGCERDYYPGDFLIDGERNYPSPTWSPTPQPRCDWKLIYPECDWNTNQVRDVYQNTCSGEYQYRNPHYQDGVCGWPKPTPAPQPTTRPVSPTCPRTDVLRVDRDVDLGDKICDFNVWQTEDCRTGRGGAYNCRFKPPAPQPTQPPAPPRQCVGCYLCDSGNWRSAGRADGQCWTTNECLTAGYSTDANQPNWCAIPGEPTPTPTQSPRVVFIRRLIPAPPQGGPINITNNPVNTQGSVNVTVQRPAKTTRVVFATAPTPAPVVQVAGVTKVTELPKTGLPTLAWVFSGLLPAGLGLKRWGKGEKFSRDTASYLWQRREFDKEVDIP